MLKTGKKHSPDAKKSGHDTSLHQGHPGTTFWWSEPKPKGGKVDHDGANQRGDKVGKHAPTIGPRVA
jgi:hypothetical protein